MKPKRKKRKKINMSEVNFMKPITIEMFGSGDDPCFGMHHSVDSKVCGQCGDAEICMIISAQYQSKVRLELESKGNFKDLEEVSIDMEELQKYIIELLEGKNKMNLKGLHRKVCKKFDPTNLLKKPEITKLIQKAVKDSSKLKVKKVDDKIYIKLK